MEAIRSDFGRRLVWAACVLAITACGTPTIEDEEDLGRRAVAEVRQNALVLFDDVVESYIDQIGQTLVHAAGPQPYDYTFTVIQDDNINAFATFGGNIFINTGLINRTRNVSELAGVLGHEVGHVVHRHMAAAAVRAQEAGWLRNAAVLGSAIGGINPGAVDLLTGYGAQGFLNTFTRGEETESDEFAVELLPRAGYDPAGIVTMFEMLTVIEGRTGPKFFSDHPTSPERTKHTRELIAAKTLPPDLKREDNGKLEIIQHRIRLLTKQSDPPPRQR